MHSHPDLFAGLATSEVDRLVSLGTALTLHPGDVLFRIGDLATHLYVVDQGLVSLTMPMQVDHHDEDVRIDECGPGHTVGWSTLVPPHRFTLNATAPAPAHVLALPREALLAHFAAHPEVGYAVMRNLATVLGQRLQVFQAMWLRQMQHVVDLAHG
ncbi:hypothetical protein TBR22_A01900 [Luteitalea sp. TBR-22]|uniref:Crp/Fnr family transcriptional regulator n=1 Tax=Luteitalea sp. TBR-22 TaxID=2802971 RepID=UPI001AF034A7|nr:cyclic nucleotide-binding domain-containing protein [Luteitalea sp. TBR-22]BCS30991.1 hypothetical protein TBR22_A01900 [Luteitalea sp. TBR-22]